MSQQDDAAAALKRAGDNNARRTEYYGKRLAVATELVAARYAAIVSSPDEAVNGAMELAVRHADMLIAANNKVELPNWVAPGAK